MSDLPQRYPPRREPPGPLSRPSPRLPKPPQGLRKRNEKRAKKRNAECFGEQADLCRKRPCLVPFCRNRPSVPHHQRSRGARGVDRDTVPLCWIHHEEAHHGQDTFEKVHGLDLEVEAEALATLLERKKGHDCEANAKLIEREPGLVSFYRCTVCDYVLPDEQEGPE